MKTLTKACIAATTTLLGLSFWTAAGAGIKAPSTPGVIRIELPHEPAGSSPGVLGVLDKLAWPVVIAFAIATLRKPLTEILTAFAVNGQLSIGSIAVRLNASESKIADQQDQLDLQTEQIKQLITFSMSWFIYEMLYQLYQAKHYGGTYLYRENGSMQRNLRFLIDHGYIQEIYEWPVDGENVLPKITFYRAGEALVKMRGLPRDTTSLIPA